MNDSKSRVAMEGEQSHEHARRGKYRQTPLAEAHPACKPASTNGSLEDEARPRLRSALSYAEAAAKRRSACAHVAQPIALLCRRRSGRRRTVILDFDTQARVCHRKTNCHARRPG